MSRPKQTRSHVCDHEGLGLHGRGCVRSHAGCDHEQRVFRLVPQHPRSCPGKHRIVACIPLTSLDDEDGAWRSAATGVCGSMLIIFCYTRNYFFDLKDKILALLASSFSHALLLPQDGRHCSARIAFAEVGGHIWLQLLHFCTADGTHGVCRQDMCRMRELGQPRVMVLQGDSRGISLAIPEPGKCPRRPQRRYNHLGV